MATEQNQPHIGKQIAFALLGFLFLVLIAFVVYCAISYRFFNGCLNTGQMAIDLAWLGLFWLTSLFLFRWSLTWPGLSTTLNIFRGIGLALALVFLLALAGMLISLILHGYHALFLPLSEWGFGPARQPMQAMGFGWRFGVFQMYRQCDTSPCFSDWFNPIYPYQNQYPRWIIPRF